MKGVGPVQAGGLPHSQSLGSEYLTHYTRFMPRSRREFLNSAAGVAGGLLLGDRAFAKSRRRDGGPVVNPHAHWFPEEWMKLVEAEGSPYDIKIRRQDGNWRLESPKLSVTISPEYFDLNRRLQKMDQQGVDVQAMSLTNPMVDWAPPALGLTLAQAFNDSSSTAHRAHPERLLGLATLPMQAPDLAVAEIERAAKLPGIRGVCISTFPASKELDDPGFYPIYAACERLGWCVFLHPVDTIGRDRLGRFYLRNLLGNPYDNGVAAAYLIFGGVLDMFPKLDVCLPHAGGTLPWVIGRLDQGVRVRPELKHMKKPASAYLRRFFYDTIVHEDGALLYLIRLVGVDRMVIGDDYPFDMGYEKPVEVVERLKGISTLDRDKILGVNAARLLRVQKEEPQIKK
jgi:aminocarboxymuconate-semialdehyde decarboxylase